MEKLFQPGKWFVLFCGVFVLLWGTLQYVSGQRLKDEAQIAGQRIYNWKWTGSPCRSDAQMTNAKILRKSESDAVVQVTGKQHSLLDPTKAADTEDCTAILTFYKRSVHDKDYWELGQVEFP